MAKRFRCKDDDDRPKDCGHQMTDNCLDNDNAFGNSRIRMRCNITKPDREKRCCAKIKSIPILYDLVAGLYAFVRNIPKICI